MILWLLTPVPFSTWDYNRDTSVSLQPWKPLEGSFCFTAELCVHGWCLANVWDGINQEKPSEESELCPRPEMSQVGGCWKMPCSQTCTLHFVCKENVALYLLRLISSSPGPPSSTMLCVVVVGWLKTQTCHQRASQSILVWSRFLKVFYLLIPHQAAQMACLGDWSRPGSISLCHCPEQCRSPLWTSVSSPVSQAYRNLLHKVAAIYIRVSLLNTLFTNSSPNSNRKEVLNKSGFFLSSCFVSKIIHQNGAFMGIL